MNAVDMFEVAMLTMDSIQNDTFDVAMLAPNTTNQDKAWYLDLGASKHVIGEPNGMNKIIGIVSMAVRSTQGHSHTIEGRGS